ncbi:MAG TPA: hypothetical protein VH054_25730 [Polyangiaceae bacterium]|nr:hypothetical protein [Polyangiaceae bacterium]
MKRIVFVVCAIGCSSSPSATDGGVDAAPSDGSAADVIATDAVAPEAGEAGASGPTVGGCPMFPASYPYNVDISAAKPDQNSPTYISNLKARAGAIVAEYPGDEYVNVVPASQAMVAVGTTASYGFDATDTFFQNNGAGAMAPIPSGVLYENSNNPNSDHHMMIVVQGTCVLYELYAWNPSSATTGWEGLVRWNLTKSEQLPDGWGSTTAAGTPLLPGAIWSDEIAAGKIAHAIDIVIPGAAIMQYGYVKPAARAGGACGSAYPADGFPYGGRLRLKPSFDDSAFTGTQAKVVITALKTYGMLNTDASGETRSSFRLGDGSKLDQTDMNQLGKLTWDDFDVPEMTVVSSKACN